MSSVEGIATVAAATMLTKRMRNFILTIAESAEKIESSTLIPTVALKGMNDYQSFGSGITYYRRYCLSSMLGLVTDKDIDASGEQTGKKLPTLDTTRFNKALESIKKGEYDKARLPKEYNLTPNQLKDLEQC